MPVALATGALGGYGQAICKVLKAKGYTVIGAARRDEACEADHLVVFDLRDLARDPEKTGIAIQEIRASTEGGLDLLVNNAAYQVVKSIEELGVDEMNETLAILRA